MAKTKTIDPRHAHRSPHKKKTSSEKRSPGELLEQAALFVQQSQPDQAAPLAFNALSQLESVAQPDPQLLVPAHVLYAQINLELGEIDKSLESFRRAVDLDPDGELSSAEPSLWLAQLSEDGGQDSIRWFERGIQILKDEVQYLQGLESADVEAQLLAADKNLRIAEALCSMAEVYMTDLSFEDDAETRCEKYATEALLVAPNSPSVLQTLASIRISQSREDEARQALERSLEIWQDLPEDDPGIPDFPARISLSRLLMEVALDSKAIPVLERLVTEDDESVEAWYLGGWCHFLQAQKGADSKEASREWLRNALRLYRLQDYEDEKLKEHAQELVATLDGELGGPIEDEDDWEDEDEDEGVEDSDFEGFPDEDGDGTNGHDVEMTT